MLRVTEIGLVGIIGLRVQFDFIRLRRKVL